MPYNASKNTDAVIGFNFSYLSSQEWTQMKKSDFYAKAAKNTYQKTNSYGTSAGQRNAKKPMEKRSLKFLRLKEDRATTKDIIHGTNQRDKPTISPAEWKHLNITKCMQRLTRQRNP